ncbi:MAG: LysM peptidoglycan-binding domain-containing protein [Defluviitaleaceae bacterium]|nr:LysM peptidoglycan-binding domain-containing protein [Defluviitaleaceae bacterium]
MENKENKLDRYDALSKEATKSLMKNRLKQVEEEEGFTQPTPLTKKISNDEEEYIRPNSRILAQKGLSLSSEEREERRRALTEEPTFVPLKRSAQSSTSATRASQQRLSEARTPQKKQANTRPVDPFTRRQPNKPKPTPPIIYIGLGLLALFIIVFVFLLIRNSSLSRQNEYLTEQLEAFQPESLAAMQNTIAELEAQVEFLEDIRVALDERVEELEGIYTSDHAYTGEQNNYTGGTDESAGTGERTHIVQPGDNLSAISTQFFGTTAYVDAIMQANGITDPTALRIDQVLIIPASTN